MKLFLSYAHEDREIVEQVKTVLESEGHDVFFDRDDLPPGGKYNSRIGAAIKGCDLFIAFLSTESLDAASYTLSEIQIAQWEWPDPEGHVLAIVLPPVRVCDISASVPAYIGQTITIHEVKGNAAAEVRYLVEEEGRKHTLENMKKSWSRGYEKGREFGRIWSDRLFGWTRKS